MIIKGICYQSFRYWYTNKTISLLLQKVIHYSTKILIISGISEEKAVYGTLFMGTINVLMTIVSLFLVDIAGRKTLLIIGMAGMMFISLILTISMSLTVSTVCKIINNFIAVGVWNNRVPFVTKTKTNFSIAEKY